MGQSTSPTEFAAFAIDASSATFNHLLFIGDRSALIRLSPRPFDQTLHIPTGHQDGQQGTTTVNLLVGWS